jgi:hypothetical protein
VTYDYEPNAPIDRLRWVAKTYEHMPVVAWETIRVALNTLGVELLQQENALFDGTDGTWGVAASSREMHWRNEFGFERGIRGALTARRISELLTMLEPELPPDSEYDFLFPWVAAQLGPIAKRTQRAWKQEQEGRITHPHAMHWYDEAPIFTAIAEALTRRGTAIAQWALANHIDLGRVTAAEAIEAAKNFKVVVRVPQGPVVYEYGDGWTVQELPPEALEAEGKVMQHCVGTYCEQVRRGDTVIYSLRDPQGQPHVTMEFLPASGRFEQIYGKQNERPKPEYEARVRAFIRDKFDAAPAAMLMAGADPKSLDLRGAYLRDANLRDANLRDANLREADLGRATLAAANLTGANLSYANLTAANLTGANLSYANLTGANLSYANLTGANLSRANLTGANLTGANLSYANLTGANLSYANLTGANLSYANLTGANLRGANTEGAVGL